MPIVRLQIFSGRPQRMKNELMKRVSEATAQVLDIPLEHVQCIIEEVPKKHWARGGESFATRKLEGKGYKHTR